MLVFKHSYGKFQEPRARDLTYSVSTENDKVIPQIVAHIWRNLQRLQIDQCSEYSVWQQWNIVWRQVSKSEKEIKIVTAFADLSMQRLHRILKRQGDKTTTLWDSGVRHLFHPFFNILSFSETLTKLLYGPMLFFQLYIFNIVKTQPVQKKKKYFLKYHH